MKEPQRLNAKELTEELNEFVRETILAENARFSPDTPLEEVGIDSVSLLEILLFLERRWGVFIPDEKLTPAHIATLRQLAETACAIGRSG
ncbi:MAG: hypothetical protein Kow0089_05410 [Desulfobulbaceae bacterium]